MKLLVAVLGLGMVSAMAAAQGLNCNLEGYKAVDGLRAVAEHGSVTLTWQGEDKQELRAQFTVRDGQPVVEELAARMAGGAWVELGKDLTPEFQVTTGRRRVSKTEKDILVRLKQDTPENEERYKWNVFWDAPLAVPGYDSSHLVGPGRTEDEIQRAGVSYKSDVCTVTTDADRVSVRFNGLTLGIFAGDLQFTAYKGSNLLRQEAIASTQAKDVAFIYKAGLKGFAIKDDTKLVWRDTSQVWQEQDFGGEVNEHGESAGAESAGAAVCGSGDAGDLPSAAQVFLCARERGEPGVRVLPEGFNGIVFAGRDAAGAWAGVRAVGCDG